MGEMAEWALEQGRREAEANGNQHEPTLPELMRAALQDGSYWVNRDFKVIPVSEIRRAYALNILSLLDRLADAFHTAECLEVCCLPMPRGEAAYDMVSGEMDFLFSRDPQEWIKEQPLYRRLEEIVAEGERRLAKIVHGR